MLLHQIRIRILPIILKVEKVHREQSQECNDTPNLLVMFELLTIRVFKSSDMEGIIAIDLYLRQTTQ